MTKNSSGPHDLVDPPEVSTETVEQPVDGDVAVEGVSEVDSLDGAEESAVDSAAMSDIESIPDPEPALAKPATSVFDSVPDEMDGADPYDPRAPLESDAEAEADEPASKEGVVEYAPGVEPAEAGLDPADGDQEPIDGAEKYRKQADENREKWLRSMAELENFRKRSRREIENTINFANANLLRELLDVLDDFERARHANAQGESDAPEAYIEGFRLIHQRFVEILRKNGLVRIHAVGQEFDPNLHEAISQIETEDVEAGHIASVIQEGYKLKEMVLRPAKVVVAK